ncbi:hypothetical protein FI667_g14083, partial [Globisporangium splendens]
MQPSSWGTATPVIASHALLVTCAANLEPSNRTKSALQGLYAKEETEQQLRDARKVLNVLKAQHNQNCVLLGHLVMKKGSRSECPRGFYYPLQTPASSSFPCLAGSYGNETGLTDAAECSKCPPGEFCSGEPPTDTPSGDCGPGHFCVGGASTKQPTDGITGDFCKGGYACFGGASLATPADNQTGKVCDPGYYCPLGSAAQIRCPKGTYNSFEKQTASLRYHARNDTTVQKARLSRFYVPVAHLVTSLAWKLQPNAHHVALANTALEAWRRVYVLLGITANCTMLNQTQTTLKSMGLELTSEVLVRRAITALKMDLSQFPVLEGAIVLMDKALCFVRLKRKQCNRTGTVDPSNYDCPPGYYRLLAESDPKPCPAGTYRSLSGGTKAEDCKACVGGSHCSAGTVQPIICDSKTFCPTAQSQFCAPKDIIAQILSINQCRVLVDTTAHQCVAMKDTFALEPQHQNGLFPESLKMDIDPYQDIIAPQEVMSRLRVRVARINQITRRQIHRFVERVLKIHGYCICEPGYEFYDQDLILRSDEDDDIDCQPIVYDRCTSNQIRSESGSCISVRHVSCDQSCNNGTGTFVSSMGLCQCDHQPDLDDICNQKCRQSSMQVQVNSTTGELQVYDPSTGTLYSLQNADASQGVVSKVSCSDTSCELHSLALESSGFTGSYDVPASLLATSSISDQHRRRLSADSSSSIANPMLCLDVGEGILFDLSTPGSYPIYLKDSMLNTNPSFDYGAFRSLATRIKSNSSSVTAFAFTFTDPGTYVFGNSLNGDAKTVVAAMSEGTTCPTDGPIVPLNEKNLISVSAKRRSDALILAPDWQLIFGLLGGLFGMVIAIITGLYYFRTKSWANSDENNEAASLSSANPVKATYQADLERWDDEDIDVRELVDRLHFHHESVSKCFEDQKGDVRKIAHQLQMEAAELKRLFVNALVASNPSSKKISIPSDQEIINPEDTVLVHGAGTSPTSESQDDRVLEKNSFLLEHLQRELEDRQRFEKRKSALMQDVERELSEVQRWRQPLGELTAAIASEMVSSMRPKTEQPETTTTANTESILEQVHSTLDNLHSLLSSDPATMTTSSVIQVADREKVRREIGYVSHGGENEAIRHLIQLQGAMAKAQNKEDEAFLTQMASLQKFGVAVPQVVKALNDLELDFKSELLELQEEQNPFKERDLRVKLEEKLRKILAELVKGAGKISDKIEKESSKMSKFERGYRDAESVLSSALESAKKQLIKNKQKAQQNDAAENRNARAVQALLNSEQAVKKEANDRAREDTLFQIKDLLIALTSELNMRNNAGMSAVSPVLPDNRLRRPLLEFESHIQHEASQSQPIQPKADASAFEGKQTDILNKSKELEARILSANQKKMREEKANGRLFVESAAHKIRNQRRDAEDNRRTSWHGDSASPSASEAMDRTPGANKKQEMEILRAQADHKQQLDQHFMQEEQAIEQEYQRELARLEQQFDMMTSDFSHLEVEDDNTSPENSEDAITQPSPPPLRTFAAAVNGAVENEIQRVKDAHQIGWQARLDQLAAEAALKKAQLVERMKKKRAALRADAEERGENVESPATVQAQAELDRMEDDELVAIDTELEAKKSQLQGEMEDEQRILALSLEDAARRKADEVERMLAACKRSHSDESEKLGQQLALERQQQEQALRDRLAKKRAQKLLTARQSATSEAEFADAVARLDAELEQEGARESEALDKQRGDDEASAWSALEQQQERELRAITLAVEEAEQRNAKAVLQQHSAEKQQESTLQQKLASKRTEKQEELAKSQIHGQAADVALQELDAEGDAEKAQLERKWDNEVSKRLQVELETQKTKEQELARLINQAALKAATADAARIAVEEMNNREASRIEDEFANHKKEALAQGLLDADLHRTCLGERLAARKDKRIKKSVQATANAPTSTANDVSLQADTDNLWIGESSLDNQRQAAELQELAQKELERLKMEHENEMKTLSASLLADQKRQEQKLQDRISQRRERKLKEAANSVNEKERLKMFEEEERKEKEALGIELAAHKIEEEKERQRLRETEVAAKIEQAAAKMAIEEAREPEIQRLASEFDEKSRELQQSNLADLASQKRKLEARIAAKKQKKLLELEAKKEMELQKLKQKQAEAIQAIEADNMKINDALERLSADERGDKNTSSQYSATAQQDSASASSAGSQERDTPNEVVDIGGNLSQEKDALAIQQLFERGLIPQHLSLMAGIEMVIGAVRDGLADLLRQKAAVKAAALSNKTLEKEKELKSIDDEYDAKIRERETHLVENIDRMQQTQIAALKEAHLDQIAFLLKQFATRNTGAIEGMKLHEPHFQAVPRPITYISEAESENADLVNELRARLQVEVNERKSELLEWKKQELNGARGQLDLDSKALETRFEKMIQIERDAIEKTFAERLKPYMGISSGNVKMVAQREKLEAEKCPQVTRFVLTLRGRMATQLDRLKKAAEKRYELIESEYNRKVDAVTAKMLQRVVEEKDTLMQKRAMVAREMHQDNANPVAHAAETSDRDSGLPNTLTRILEEHLTKIENIMRDKLATIERSPQPKLEKSIEKVDHAQIAPGSAANPGSVADTKVLREAICRGYSITEDFFPLVDTLTADTMKKIQANAISRDAVNAPVEVRLDFVNFVLQLLAPTLDHPGSVLPQCRAVIVKSLCFDTSSTPKPSPFCYFDSKDQVLYLRIACFQELSAGQLAVMTLYAVTQAAVKTADVSDPVFVAKLNELLLQCYQNLFQAKQTHPASENQSSIDTQQKGAAARPLGDTTRRNHWQSSLHEMESFLSSLDRIERMTESSSSTSFPARDMVMESDKNVPPRRLSPLMNASSSRYLLSKMKEGSTPSANDLFAIQEHKQFLEEKLDTTEKLYAQVLQQYQEQKESLDYLQEVLTEEQERADEGDGNGHQESDSEPPEDQLLEIRREVAELEAALENSKKERDELFAQCQGLQDELGQLTQPCQ